MNLFGYTPIDYFNRWLARPIGVASGASVQSVLDALNRHPLAQDETAQDYVMPAWRYREKPGRFRILGENQDTWYGFVYEGEESLPDPPVYFETCLDLKLDHGFSDNEIIGGDHVQVCPQFTAFLWHMLGHLICVRHEGNGQYAAGVHGAVFKMPITMDAAFINPLGHEFPAGHTCFIGPDAICIPDWGAAFLNPESGDRFLTTYRPVVSRRWS
jgi:hypothetical protein